MAKGNLFHGLGRGKVGDVVLYRKNGEQISRVRVRHISNPKTTAQQTQRAVMATIMQAYSAGKEIFDHSFEGKKVGAENMNRFMSVNSKALRSALAGEIAAGTAEADSKVRFVAPGANQPVPLQLIVSEGSYNQSLFTFNPEDNSGEEFQPAFYSLPAVIAGETIAAYCARNGIIAGDLYTIVSFGIDQDPDGVTPLFEVANVSSKYAKTYPCVFGFVRLQVKESALSDTTVITSSTLLTALFDVTASENVNYGVDNLTVGNVTIDYVFAGTYHAGAIGIIRSAINEDKRSNTTLQFFGDMAWGLTSNYVQAAWLQGTTQVGDSDLILEGANF